MSRWNFRRANWDAFRNKMDSSLDLQQLGNMEENEANSYICKAILDAAGSRIPRGSNKKYKPFWNQDIEQAIKERQKSRENYMKNNTPENRTKYHKISAETKLLINNSKKRHGLINVKDSIFMKEAEKPGTYFTTCLEVTKK